jgi:hypothetical protein
MTCYLSDQILSIIVVDEKSSLLVFYKKEKIFFNTKHLWDTKKPTFQPNKPKKRSKPQNQHGKNNLYLIWIWFLD